jgi:hypothetical protein
MVVLLGLTCPSGGGSGGGDHLQQENIKSFTHLIKQKITRVKPITKTKAPSIYKYHYNYESDNP